MRLATAVLCLMLGLCGGVRAGEAPAAANTEGFALSHGHEEHYDPRLDAIADTPHRPAWAPLPVLRGSTELVSFAQGMMKSPDAPSRARAAFLLGQIGWSGSADLLVQGLKDSERSVRVQCGIALACMGDARGVPTCAAVLTNDLAWVRYYAAYGLWCVNGPRAIRILKNGYDKQGTMVTAAIRGALISPHARPPDVAMPKGSAGPSLSADDVLEAVTDAFVRESDWWWHKGDHEQCIRSMEAQVFMDPSDVETYGLIAWLQKSRGRRDEAEKTLIRACADNPTDPDAYFELAHHRMSAGDYQDAEEPARKSVAFGGDVLAQRQYAHCLEKVDKLVESLAQWEKILQAFPDDEAARYNHDRVKALIDTGSGG